MKLTGKCKEEFEKWLSDQDCYNYETLEVDCDNALGMNPHEVYWFVVFDKLPRDFKYGVYVNYFDSVLISVSCYRISKEWVQYDVIDYKHDDFNVDEQESYRTRQEARDKAIEKANQIRNKQLKQ